MVKLDTCKFCAKIVYSSEDFEELDYNPFTGGRKRYVHVLCLLRESQIEV